MGFVKKFLSRFDTGMDRMLEKAAPFLLRVGLTPRPVTAPGGFYNLLADGKKRLLSRSHRLKRKILRLSCVILPFVLAGTAMTVTGLALPAVALGLGKMLAATVALAGAIKGGQSILSIWRSKNAEKKNSYDLNTEGGRVGLKAFFAAQNRLVQKNSASLSILDPSVVDDFVTVCDRLGMKKYPFIGFDGDAGSAYTVTKAGSSYVYIDDCSRLFGAEIILSTFAHEAGHIQREHIKNARDIDVLSAAAVYSSTFFVGAAPLALACLAVSWAFSYFAEKQQERFDEYEADRLCLMTTGLTEVWKDDMSRAFTPAERAKAYLWETHPLPQDRADYADVFGKTNASVCAELRQAFLSCAAPSAGDAAVYSAPVAAQSGPSGPVV